MVKSWGADSRLRIAIRQKLGLNATNEEVKTATDTFYAGLQEDAGKSDIDFASEIQDKINKITPDQIRTAFELGHEVYLYQLTVVSATSDKRHAVGNRHGVHAMRSI